MKTKTSILAIYIAALLVASVTGCGSKQKGTDDTSASPPDSLIYKTTPQGELKLHFSYPENWTVDGEYPAMVFFFGGGWVNGKVDHFKDQAEYFASRGFVTARADYRVKSRHGTTPDKCVEDGKSAIRWVRAHAKDLGVDPDRIIASGGSAGGHVAACTWTVSGLEADGEDLNISSKPELLVLFNPVMSTNSDRFAKRLGSEEMASLISPNDHLTSETPPMIMFFGSGDGLIAGAYSTLEIADKLGIHAELWTAEDQKHGFFNRPPWKEWTLVLADRFLVQQRYLEGEALISAPDSVNMTLFQPAD